MADPSAYLARLSKGESLDESETYAAISGILTEGWSDPEVVAFLTFLHNKQIVADELVGAARALLDNAIKIDVPAGPLFDNCGTGGDKSGTFNISTAAAFVVAACGVKVAKHGNRGFSSRTGSADVLQELGVNIDAPPATVAQCVGEIGIGFFFAPHWHPTVAKIQHIRRGLKFPTIFNLLGPLANPLRPTMRLIGVGGASRQGLLRLEMAVAALRLGVTSSTVVVGEDGLDEVTLTGPTRVMWGGRSTIEDKSWSPEDFGLPQYTGDEWKVDGPKESASLIRRLFANEQGPSLDIVLANAAAALLTAEAAKDLRDGVAKAREAIASGAAADKLDALVRRTRS